MRATHAYGNQLSVPTANKHDPYATTDQEMIAAGEGR